MITLLLDYARTGLSWGLLGAGALLLLGGAIGLLRFPDVYTRLHAASAMISVGVSLSLIGLLLVSGSWAMAGRIGLLVVIVSALAPVFVHAAARGSQAAGLTPLVGAYKAPRPGQRGGE